MNASHDAVVIGGGPAGTSAALLLARAGWSVALVERKTFPRRKVCGEYLSATNLPLLDCLGIGERFRALAGPPVKRVGLFAGRTIAESNLPAPARGHADWGRALSREHLDTWLLDQARAAGVDIRHPCAIEQLTGEAGEYVCQASSTEMGAMATLRAPVVIAAHGSWDPGRLPTQQARRRKMPADLLAFKAHFHGSDLPKGLMPLLAFPGGYGGMVHCDEGRVSLSCCIRRDELARIRSRHPGNAGAGVLAHIQESCLGVRRALAWATRGDAWLAAGPIFPGIHIDSPVGIFRVGNAAGEAHPVVAEGISMALQSSWLLAERLIAWKRNHASPRSQTQFGNECRRVQKDYASAWRKTFAPRMRASSAIAHWAMRPAAVSLSLPLFWCFPTLLTWGARLSGKVNAVIR
jgi:menaquinone-9 beta-reductase